MKPETDASDPKETVPAPAIMVFTELVLPPLTSVVPKRTEVVAPDALVKVTVDPAPPVIERASKVNPVPVILRLALLAIKMVFVPVAVWSVPLKVLFAELVQVYPEVNQFIPATV